MRRVGQRLPDFFWRVTQFSDENERPLLSVLSHLRPAGRTRCVLLAIDHLSSYAYRPKATKADSSPITTAQTIGLVAASLSEYRARGGRGEDRHPLRGGVADQHGVAQ